MLKPFEFEWHKEELPDPYSVSKDCTILYLTYCQGELIEAQVLFPGKVIGSSELDWIEDNLCGRCWAGDAHYWTFLKLE